MTYAQKAKQARKCAEEGQQRFWAIDREVTRLSAEAVRLELLAIAERYPHVQGFKREETDQYEGVDWIVVVGEGVECDDARAEVEEVTAWSNPTLDLLWPRDPRGHWITLTREQLAATSFGAGEPFGSRERALDECGNDTEEDTHAV